MNITSKSGYYKALFEREILLEMAEGTITEVERELLNYLNKDIEEWEKKEKEEEDKKEIVELDEFHWHEAGDRAEFVGEILEILVAHPAIAQTEELKEKIDKAQELVFDVYEIAMQKSTPE